MEKVPQLPQRSRGLESQTSHLDSTSSTQKNIQAYKQSSTNLGRQLVRQNLRVSFAPAEQLETIHTIEKVEILPESAYLQRFHLEFNKLLVLLEVVSIDERHIPDYVSRVEKGVNFRTRELTNTISQLPYDRRAQIQSSYFELIQKSSDVIVKLSELRLSTQRP